PRTDSLSS
ncbi:hypothetical protein RT53_17615, partial [Escherichia coli]